MEDKYSLTTDDIAFIVGHTHLQIEIDELLECVCLLKEYPQTSNEMKDVFNEFISLHKKFTMISDKQCETLFDKCLNK